MLPANKQTQARARLSVPSMQDLLFLLLRTGCTRRHHDLSSASRFIRKRSSMTPTLLTMTTLFFFTFSFSSRRGYYSPNIRFQYHRQGPFNDFSFPLIPFPSATTPFTRWYSFPCPKRQPADLCSSCYCCYCFVFPHTVAIHTDTNSGMHWPRMGGFNWEGTGMMEEGRSMMIGLGLVHSHKMK